MSLDDFHRYVAAMIRDIEYLMRTFPDDAETLHTWRALRDRLVFTLRTINQVAGNTAQMSFSWRSWEEVVADERLL